MIQLPAIVTIDDDPGVILKTVAAPVIFENDPRPSDKQYDDLLILTSDMIQAMLSSNGVGLAAPQIGISQRIIVARDIDPAGRPMDVRHWVMINPVIIRRSMGDIRWLNEACLSVPGVAVRVPRPQSIKVTWKTINGKDKSLSCKGLLARIIQHEIDHLNGILITDIAAPISNPNLAGEELG